MLRHDEPRREHLALGVLTGPVRAENLVHSSDQQGCSPCRPAVMIIGHVPAVHVPPDHAAGCVAAARPAGGDMEDRRDLDPAPSARRPAAAAAALARAVARWLGPARGEETWKTAEILILPHQLAVLQRQQPRRPELNWADRALLATLLSVIPKARGHGLHLLVTPVIWGRRAGS